MLIYAEFLRDLLAYHAANPPWQPASKPSATLHVIGESHSLTPAHGCLAVGAETLRVTPHLIMGAKAYFFTPAPANSWKDALADILRALPKDDYVAVGFGELDCRIDEGIMEQCRRDPHYDMEAEVATLCAAYVGFVKHALRRRRGAAYILGVPAPNRAGRAHLEDAGAGLFVAMIRHMHACLRAQAHAQQLGFIDLYAATVDADGWAKPGMHIDAVHLLPSVTLQAIEAALNIA